MKTFRLLLLPAILMTFISHAAAQAPDFDYERYPRLDFSISHLELDLTVNPDDLGLAGTANYRLKANIPGVDTLVMRAAHMEITEVRLDDEEAPFHLHDDSLFIALPGNSEANQAYQVSISYETGPRFGILKNAEGSLWSSHLPLAQSHWLPVIDHPRVAFTSSLRIQVPSGYQVVASGVKMEEEVVDINTVRHVYNSENPLPVSGLSLAIGKFESAETSFGVKNITLHHEKGTIGDDQRQNLLEEASRQLQNTEEELGTEYPYDRLHVVVLSDHFGETKSWGATTVYLYLNRGDLVNQLRRGIAAQWFGIHQREERWADANAINLLQTGLHFRMLDKPSLMQVQDIPFEAEANTSYDSFGPEQWNHIQQHFSRLDSTFRTTVMKYLPEISKWRGGVYSFRDYGDFWYEKTGQPVFELKFAGVKQARDVAAVDTIRYRVDYNLNESESQLKLTFSAREGVFEDLVTLPLVHRAEGVTDTLEVTFTGTRDSVIVNVSPLVNNVDILEQVQPGLVLNEYKPASFLIYTLRQDTSVTHKVEAAENLGSITGNPDLQLAIQDLMSKDTNPRVRAALLSALGKITGGASGTEKVFLEALDNENKYIQQAALGALENYGQSSDVSQALQDYVARTESMDLFEDALRVYASVADSASFQQWVNQTVQTDTAGYKAIGATAVLARKGNTERAVRQAEYYLSDVYDYPIRAQALNILLEHSGIAGNWEGRVRRLLNDIDPRIRYLTVVNLRGIENLETAKLVNTLMMDEYDERVYRAMESILNSEF